MRKLWSFEVFKKKEKVKIGVPHGRPTGYHVAIHTTDRRMTST
jgi:hypothetical protein